MFNTNNMVFLSDDGSISLIKVEGPQATGDEFIEYITSHKGNPQLCINGFPFVRNDTRDGTTYWRCVQGKVFGYAVYL